NFSAKGETTWYEYALFISKHFLKYNPLWITAVSAINSKAKRPLYSVLDNTKSLQIRSKQSNWQNSVDEVVISILNN
ncbi:MAG: sugar nucleotide-binding protein, partial [Flavobacteriaceae bacterium]